MFLKDMLLNSSAKVGTTATLSWMRNDSPNLPLKSVHSYINHIQTTFKAVLTYSDPFNLVWLDVF